ncbi:hypothetical protein HNV12_03555 [Methanococcoides sp. SA1]|nr:hypothetical protein [Methanococcoides sp. SA1]
MVKEKEVVVEDGEKVSGETIENENRQMVWFFVIVGLVFAAVLIPYFWSESSKTFEYAEVDWKIEEYAEPTGEIFHGRFLSFTNENLYYNVFLREDPRTNDVYTEGTFDDFKYGGYVSWDEEVEGCRGELSRVMLDLGAFLKQGVGVGELVSSASNMEFADSSGREFVDCGSEDRTVVIVDIGEESKVVQDEENLNCYTITATSCDDLSGVEKFIVKSVEDFRSTNPINLK